MVKWTMSFGCKLFKLSVLQRSHRDAAGPLMPRVCEEHAAVWLYAEQHTAKLNGTALAKSGAEVNIRHLQKLQIRLYPYR